MDMTTGYMKNPVPLADDNVQPDFIPADVDSSTGASGLHGVIKVSGILSKGVSEVEEQLLGLTDVDWVRNMVDMLAEDPSVKDIIICWSSPGGETTGIEELGRRIEEVDKSIKPVYSWCESQADSAAFWLFTQGRVCGMTPSAQVGGCGVYMLVLDETKKMENEGVSIDAIYSGVHKMIGHEFRKLTEEERKILQEDVEKQHAKFKTTVLAKRSKTSIEDLEGLSFGGEDALAKGFVDHLCDDLDEFVAIIDNNESIDMKPTVEKVKVATSSEVAEKAETKKLTPMEALTEAFRSFMSGQYDGGYAEKVPGVPGTEKSAEEVAPEKKEETPGTDYAKKAEDDHKEPDGDECACSACGGTGKTAKAAKAEDHAEPDADDKKEEELPPKKEEGKYDGGYEKKAESVIVEKAQGVKNYTREDLMSMCGVFIPKKADSQTNWEKMLSEFVDKGMTNKE
jgi:signal peptide peptidase SppA